MLLDGVKTIIKAINSLISFNEEGLYHYKLEIPYASDTKEAEKMLAHLWLHMPHHRDYPSKCGQYEICTKVSLLWDSQFILLTVMMKWDCAMPTTH